VVTSEWQNKLPDFVKRLEEALYRYAQTKVRAPSWGGCACCGSCTRLTVMVTIDCRRRAASHACAVGPPTRSSRCRRADADPLAVLRAFGSHLTARTAPGRTPGRDRLLRHTPTAVYARAIANSGGLYATLCPTVFGTGPAPPPCQVLTIVLLITPQDAYLDERTLESRLQYVARKMVQKPGSSQRQAQHSGAQQAQQQPQQQQAAVPSTDSSQTSAAAPGLANGTAPAPVSNGFAHGHGPGEAAGSPFAAAPMQQHQQQMHAPQRPGSASGWHSSGGGQAANPMSGMGGHTAPPQAMSTMPMASGIAGVPAAQQASGLGGGLGGGGMMPNGLSMGYVGGGAAGGGGLVGGGMGGGMGMMANGAPPGAMRNLHNPTSMNGTLRPAGGSLGGSGLMPDPLGPLGQLPKPENGMLGPKLEGVLPGSSSGLGISGSGHASPMAAHQHHQQQHQVGMMQQYGAPPQQQPSAAQQYAMQRHQHQQQPQQSQQQQMLPPSQLPGYGMQQWQQQQQPAPMQQQAYSQPHQMASQDMYGMAPPSMAQQQQQQQQQQRMGMGYGGAGAGILRGPAAAGAAPSAGAVMSNGVPVLRNQRAAWSTSPTPGMMAVRRRSILLVALSFLLELGSTGQARTVACPSLPSPSISGRTDQRRRMWSVHRLYICVLMPLAYS